MEIMQSGDIRGKEKDMWLVQGLKYRLEPCKEQNHNSKLKQKRIKIMIKSNITKSLKIRILLKEISKNQPRM